MFVRILSIVFPVFAIAAIGYLYGRRKQPELSVANQMNMDVFIPALVFGALAAKSFQPAQYQLLAVAGVLTVIASGLAGWLAARMLGVAPRTFAPPIMFNNSGNLGLPLAVLAFGDAALAPAVVLFVISNLLHFSVGNYLLDHRARLSNLWRLPVVIASVGGLVVSLAGVEIWPPLMVAIRMVGDISVPLLLFALGVRLSDSSLQAWRIGVVGAIARPSIGVALTLAIAWLLGLEGQQRALLLVFGALPPAVLNYVFAERYRQEPDKVASIVMIGNLASLLFIPLALGYVLD